MTIIANSKDSNSNFYYLLKRIIDILSSIIAIIVLIPLSIVIKIAFLFSKDMRFHFFYSK